MGDSIAVEPIDENEGTLKAVLVAKTVTKTFLIDNENMAEAGHGKPRKKLLCEVQKTNLVGW